MVVGRSSSICTWITLPLRHNFASARHPDHLRTSFSPQTAQHHHFSFHYRRPVVHHTGRLPLATVQLRPHLYHCLGPLLQNFHYHLLRDFIHGLLGDGSFPAPLAHFPNLRTVRFAPHTGRACLWHEGLSYPSSRLFDGRVGQSVVHTPHLL